MATGRANPTATSQSKRQRVQRHFDDDDEDVEHRLLGFDPVDVDVGDGGVDVDDERFVDDRFDEAEEQTAQEKVEKDAEIEEGGGQRTIGAAA